MISVTISVTKGPLHLEQIHHIAIQNITPPLSGSDVHTYAVTIDGEDIGAVLHDPDNGAVALVAKALGIIADDTEKQATQATQRLVELVEGDSFPTNEDVERGAAAAHHEAATITEPWASLKDYERERWRRAFRAGVEAVKEGYDK